jgi:hypothetical protein
MTMLLSDLISVQRGQSAIDLTSGLEERHLAATFMPTDASIAILKKIERAVQPDANMQDRALNWFGTYGAGKSRLAVLVGQILRDGAGGKEFNIFLDRLANVGENRLASALKTTFLPPSDDDALPYFLVPIYGNQAGSIQQALVEALYRAIKASGLFSPSEILPNTTYDVAVLRLDAMVGGRPDLLDDYLPGQGFDSQYNNIAELRDGLKHHESTAFRIFCEWHFKITLGSNFSPEQFGASSVIDIYLVAAAELGKRKYRGIAVIWDELGFAIEDMLLNSMRNAQREIIELQQFIEKVCIPALGHTLFIGLTHVGLAEYGPRQNAADGLKQRLETIEGRFSAMKVELKAVEAEGYHLLAAQIHHTAELENLIANAGSQIAKISDSCKSLPVFSHLSENLDFLVKNCYPLHPITAAALLAMSNEYAAATRTAFTFLPTLEEKNRLQVTVDPFAPFDKELVRVGELITYYSDRMRTAGMGEQLDAYFLNIAQTDSENTPQETIAERKNVLAVVLLSSVLGHGFQSSDQFLAVALHDTTIADVSAEPLRAALSWLAAAGLLWKNDTTGLWKAGGDGSTNVDKLIDDAIGKVPNIGMGEYFARYVTLANDILPMLGHHYLDPSQNGIVRAYAVEAVIAEKASAAKIDVNTAAKVVIVLHENLEQVIQLENNLIEKPIADIFYWLSYSEPVGVREMLQRYIAISSLLSQSHNEGTRIRLMAKFEAIRTTILSTFSLFFGREGIRRGMTKVIHQGHPSGLPVESWSGFRGALHGILEQTFFKELAVRAPQKRRNVHGDTSSCILKETLEIAERIFDFPTNNAYQNDLLGFAENSEPGAVVDGLLGANSLFVERSTGWDLKRPEESQGNVKDVVDLIREKLLRRRDKPYQINELAKELSSAPFGIPYGAISTFIAFALQKDVEKLIWPSGKSAARSICEGITDPKIGARFGDFSTYQLNVLEVLKNAIDKIDGESTVWERNPHDRGRQALDGLRAFVKGIPADIVKSPELDKRLRELCDVFRVIGATPHDIVEKIALLIDPSKQLQGVNPPYEKLSSARSLLVDILTDGLRVENETRFKIIKFVREVIPGGDSTDSWNIFLEYIRRVSPLGSDAASILAIRPISDSACVRMIERAAGARIDDISDLQVGYAIHEIKQLMSAASALVESENDKQDAREVDRPEHDDQRASHDRPNHLIEIIPNRVHDHWQSSLRAVVMGFNDDVAIPRTELVKLLHELTNELQLNIGHVES